MNNTRKTRIPSVQYLEQKIAQIGATSNPTQDEILLLAHFKKLLEQRIAGSEEQELNRVEIPTKIRFLARNMSERNSGKCQSSPSSQTLNKAMFPRNPS